jgi:biotin carboxyl carrier protein
VQGSDLRELELSDGDIQVRLHRSPALAAEAPPAGPAVEAPAGPAIATVRASLVGTFYRAGHPGMAPLVTLGSRVEE